MFFYWSGFCSNKKIQFILVTITNGRTERPIFSKDEIKYTYFIKSRYTFNQHENENGGNGDYAYNRRYREYRLTSFFFYFRAVHINLQSH